MNKVMKYQIIKPLDTNWETLGTTLYNLQRDTREIMNKSIQLCWEYQGFSSEYKLLNGNYPKTIDILHYKSIDGYCYDKLKTQYNRLNTSNLTTSIIKATNKWKNDLKEIISGVKNPPNYKKDIPIDLHNKTIRLSKEDKSYLLDLSLISNSYKKEIDRKSGQFTILIKANDNTQKVILDRILSGEYKICASQIVKLKNKWFINLCYGFEPIKRQIDYNNVMGIDMGIVYPIYMAFNNSFDRYKIEGGEIENFRKGIERRKYQLQKQTKYCGNGRRGHGITTRTKAVEFAENRVSNFTLTTNHNYSRYVIDMAIKHNCGLIQMEDLSGINKGNKFLKNWSYYQLQSLIEYKAKEKGIKVIKINPEYTSQRCSKCGFIHANNRPKDTMGQSYFKCLECGFEVNADYNAAKNIATPDIEQLIQKELEKAKQRELIHKKDNEPLLT